MLNDAVYSHIYIAASEQSIRSFCIGKKNFVIIDTVSGAKASAVIYSLVETAKANNLNVYEYKKICSLKSPIIMWCAPAFL